MEHNMTFSPEELRILDRLWDDDDDDCNFWSTTTPSSVLSGATELEEKLLSIEKGADVTNDVVDDIKNADNADIDAILAKDMADLSVQEREYVVKDIHGIADTNCREEDNDFLQQRLQQLEDCLTRIQVKTAYDRALYQSPDYVRNDAFRLLFLRAEVFKIQAAAQLMVLHFEEKQRLFGADLLGQDILLADLSDADKEELEKGSFQVLPIRDRAGRIIVCSLGTPFNEATSLNRVCLLLLLFLVP
jgi:hypothetical protein